MLRVCLSDDQCTGLPCHTGCMGSDLFCLNTLHILVLRLLLAVCRLPIVAGAPAPSGEGSRVPCCPETNPSSPRRQMLWRRALLRPCEPSAHQTQSCQCHVSIMCDACSPFQVYPPPRLTPSLCVIWTPILRGVCLLFGRPKWSDRGGV